MFERVVATSTRLKVDFHVEGNELERGGPVEYGRGRFDGRLPFGPGAQSVVLEFSVGRDNAHAVLGPTSQWVDERIQSDFTRTGSGWLPWSAETGAGALSGMLTDGSEIVIRLTGTQYFLGAPEKVILRDESGESYASLGATFGQPEQRLVFAGPVNRSAMTLSLRVDGYWVPETQEWTVEIPVR